MSDHQQLFLVSARSSRTSGDWGPDDYDVRDGSTGGPVIGRIFLSATTSRDQPWLWTITTHQSRPEIRKGFAASRAEAMTAFKVAWERG
jgi:hypothetical protein